MNLLTYSELLSQFQQTSNFLSDMPEEIIYSVPVCMKRSNGLYDAFFLYSSQQQLEQALPTRPFAWAAFSANGTASRAFNWCSITDFVSTEQFPLGSVVSAKLPGPLTSHRQNLAYGEIIDAYEKIRLFAFKEDTTVAQLQIIAYYKNIFSEIVPEGLYPFYYALAPDFFDWMRLPLPKIGLTSSGSPFRDKEILEELRALSLAMRFQELSEEKNQRIIEELHSEVQQHRNNMLCELTDPIERDVIMVIDTIQKTLHTFRLEADSNENFQQLYHLFRGVEQDLTDLLYRQGVDPYSVEGNHVKVPRQKVISTLSTTNKSLDKTVAKRMALGWEKNDRIVRPEYVSAYIYRPDENNGEGDVMDE